LTFSALDDSDIKPTPRNVFKTHSELNIEYIESKSSLPSGRARSITSVNPVNPPTVYNDSTEGWKSRLYIVEEVF
jgi:hypothetical protein